MSPSRTLDRTHALAGLSIVLLLVGLRVTGLGSYPAAMPDEGFWASGPRNWVLFGSPLLDGRLHSFLSPATFAALSLWFSIVPPSLVSARYFSVLTGLLSCAFMGVIARRCFPDRAWWLIVFYGASGLAVFIDRSILIESHQMLWLILAATLWLGHRPGAWIGAGVAFGIALLVKSNSLYVMPAFCLSVPRRADRSDLESRALVSFLAAAALVASCGYLAAWALDPSRFVTAFTFELDGAHLVNRHVLFHYGRAGLNPHLLRITAKEVLFADPFVSLSGLAGMIWVFSRFASAERADRFFASWAVFGLVSNLVQIYPQYRYLTTTTPALAYLGVRVVGHYLAGGIMERTAPMRATARILVVAVACSFVAYQVAQVAVAVSRRANAPYWRLVDWFSQHVPPEANALAAPYIGISLTNRSYDFMRLFYDYDGVPRPIEGVVEDHGISRIIVDGQWKKYQSREMKEFLAGHCAVEGAIDGFRVFACGRAS